MGDTLEKVVVKEDNVMIVVDVKCESRDVAYIKHTASVLAAYLVATPKLRRVQFIMSADMMVQLAKLSLLMEGESNAEGSP